MDNNDATESLFLQPSERIHKRPSDRGICWLYAPPVTFGLDWIVSNRGSENLHLYLWLLKDLSWAEDWYYPGMVFGSLAVAWAFWIFIHAVVERATDEIFIRFAVLIWISANIYW